MPLTKTICFKNGVPKVNGEGGWRGLRGVEREIQEQLIDLAEEVGKAAAKQWWPINQTTDQQARTTALEELVIRLLGLSTGQDPHRYNEWKTKFLRK